MQKFTLYFKFALCKLSATLLNFMWSKNSYVKISRYIGCWGSTLSSYQKITSGTSERFQSTLPHLVHPGKEAYQIRNAAFIQQNLQVLSYVSFVTDYKKVSSLTVKTYSRSGNFYNRWCNPVNHHISGGVREGGRMKTLHRVLSSPEPSFLLDLCWFSLHRSLFGIVANLVSFD